MAAKIDEKICTSCEICVEECPNDAIIVIGQKVMVTKDCIDCGACIGSCPEEAIELE